MARCISAMPIGLKPGPGLRRDLCADVHGGRWAAEKQQNRDRDGRRGDGESASGFLSLSRRSLWRG